MRRFVSRTIGVLAVLTAGALPAKAQVGYNAVPVYSNGFVVNVPSSPAAPTTVYYPGGTGASVYPSPNVTVSGQNFVYAGSDGYGSLFSGRGMPRTFLPPNTPPVPPASQGPARGMTPGLSVGKRKKESGKQEK